MNRRIDALFRFHQVTDLRQQLHVCRRFSRSWGGFLVETIDLSHNEEDRESDDEEIDDGLEEEPILHLSTADADGERREIDLADQDTDERHENIIHEGRDNLPESCADDDADGQIEGIALHREVAEFFQDGHGRSGKKRMKCTKEDTRRSRMYRKDNIIDINNKTLTLFCRLPKTILPANWEITQNERMRLKNDNWLKAMTIRIRKETNPHNVVPRGLQFMYQWKRFSRPAILASIIPNTVSNTAIIAQTS